MGSLLVGPVFAQGYACRTCGCNAVNAVILRHGAAAPPVVRTLRCPKDRLFPLVRCEYAHFDSLYYEAWLDSWPAGKRAAILRSCAHDPLLPDWTEPHVKLEHSHNFPTRARLIQAYKNLRTQAEYGPQFRSMQKALCRVLFNFEWAPGITVTIASGMAYPAIAKWMVGKEHLWFYERDGKNWDATMQLMHHNFKADLYDYLCPGLAEFVDAGFKVRGRLIGPNGVFDYTLDGTVKSGFNDTTSGNSYINGAIAACALQDAGLTGHVLVAGDDLVCAIDTDFDCDALVAIEAQYGIKPVARKFRSYVDVTFISGQWFRNGNSFVFVPLLGRLLARLWWASNPPAPKHESAYIHSVSSGLAVAVGQIPGYRAIVVYNDRPAGHYRPGSGYEYAGFVSEPISQDIVFEVCRRYQISISDLADLEGVLAIVGQQACYIKHHVADIIMNRDLCDIGVRPLSW